MAERWKFVSFVLFSFVISTVIYPDLRELGVGRRLALRARQELRARSRSRRLRRQLRGAHDRRRGRLGRREDARPAHRQVHARTAERTRSPVTTSRWRCSAPSSSRSAGSASTRARRLPCTDSRISIVAVNTMLASASGAVAAASLRLESLRQARIRHGAQRHARRHGRDHGAVRVRRRAGFHSDRRRRRRPRRRLRAVRRAEAAGSTIRSAPRASTALAEFGAFFHSDSLPTARTVTDGTESRER